MPGEPDVRCGGSSNLRVVLTGRVARCGPPGRCLVHDADREAVRLEVPALGHGQRLAAAGQVADHEPVAEPLELGEVGAVERVVDASDRAVHRFAFFRRRAALIASSVSGPATPSATSLWSCWKRFSAATAGFAERAEVEALQVAERAQALLEAELLAALRAERDVALGEDLAGELEQLLLVDRVEVPRLGRDVVLEVEPAATAHACSLFSPLFHESTSMAWFSWPALMCGAFGFGRAAPCGLVRS
jgi:hypothetical protein